MGSIASAIYDDENDWYDFKKLAGITDLTDSVYSEAARFAKAGFYDNNYSGARLKLYIKHMLEVQNLKTQHAKELKEYEEYLNYKARFE